MEPVDPRMEAARRALRAFHRGEPHDERCPRCGGKIEVHPFIDDPSNTAWFVRCPCGATSGQFKGL